MKSLFRAFTFAICIILCFSECKNASKAPETDFVPYISAYTGGVISEDASIRIDLAREVPEQARTTDGLFSFSPSVKGSVRWTSPASVIFFPDQGALTPGKNYKAVFNLGKVLDVEKKSLKTFKFGFTVKGADTKEVSENASGEIPGNGFHISAAYISGTGNPHIEIVFSGTPANALKKGLIELEGASRFYTEQQGSVINVFYEDVGKDITLKVSSSVKDASGATLGQDFVKVFPLGDIPPAVEIALQGQILPNEGDLVLPFRAVNLAAVELRIVKIYPGNVLMFLQDNDLGEEEYLRRAGRLVCHKDIALDPKYDLHTWNNFSIDLSGLLRKDPGAIYRIRLSFREDQSLYGGRTPDNVVKMSDGTPDAKDEAIWDSAQPWYWDNDYDWNNYKYKERNDPTRPSYFMESSRFPVAQLLTSDLGLVAKYAGGDKIWVGANNLITAKPAAGVQLTVYDFQLQKIGQARTGSDGMVEIPVSRRPFVVTGTSGNSVTYLKVNDGNEKSLSRFDTGGETVGHGLKAFIYGERGVWRPGDTLHLTMILQSKDAELPSAHPATLELYTPEGQFHSRLVRQGLNGFYAFDIPTSADDPTGFWNAYVIVGGSSFHKTLHIETIKPNRLKINIDYGSEPLVAGSTVTVPISASWLTGSPASGLKARAVMTLRRSSSQLRGYEKYSFTVPGAEFTSTETKLFETKLNSEGKAYVGLQLPPAANAPGMLNATIMTAVQEDAGDESFTTATVPFSPYTAYVGVRIPDEDYLETDKDQTIRFAVVGPDGKRISGHKLEYRIFKTGWNWWLENSATELDSYVNGSSVQLVSGGTLVSGSSDATCTVRVNYPDWGRFIVIVKDLDSGHVSGRSFIIDWPEYRGRADRRDPENLTMLTFSTDKSSYKVGEKATVYLPAAPGGQALISVENSTRVLSSSWVSTGDTDRAWSMQVTEDMAPDFYIHVTLVQPRGKVANELPVRLYGVQRVLVENPQSHLHPVLDMPGALHPEEEFTLSVSESSGRPMTYTLAIVDEGLLDLTAFKTPDPWKAMNKVEALGVRTWDMYDNVIGILGGQFAKIAAIGGDQDNIVSARNDNRFNPVVYVLPPSQLAKGAKAKHKIKLPMYVGSVRVMLVAGQGKAFGNAEKTVPVTAPLMILPSAPRTLSPGEEIQLPVNVFAMEDGIRSADVSVDIKGPVELTGNRKQTITFNGKGDQLVRFALKANGEGTATITVNASGAGHKAYETVSIPVANPNPVRATVTRRELPAGATASFTPAGTSYLQLTAFPAFDARALYQEMLSYPYNCSEQLAARGLSFLHLASFLGEKPDAAQIDAIVRQLYSRQNADGGFGYWNGGSSNSWVSSMAGLFLSEAAKSGYKVDRTVLQTWTRYQQKLSNAYRIAGNSAFPHLDEAFRLYTLAAAGSPSTASMNRLKEDDSIGYRAKWMLASAYALCGKKQVASDMIAKIDRSFENGNPYNITFGTSLRDKFLALEAMALTSNLAEAIPLAQELVSEKDLSTQETAFAAIAFDRLRSEMSASSVKATVGGRQISAKAQVSVPVESKVDVKNTSDGPLYLTFVDLVKDPAGTSVPATSNGLSLSVRYESGGKVINASELRQGMLFTAVAEVKNLSKVSDYDMLALSLNIPSGWEIQNERLMGGSDVTADIRDDRCDWFFSLEKGHSKVFRLSLRAAYEGSYILPSSKCSAMYEPEISACTASSNTEVVR